MAYNEPYVEYYFRHPAYNTYPVVGVNWLQANDFCAWRTDRVNEMVLIDEGILEMDPNQIGEENFNMAVAGRRKTRTCGSTKASGPATVGTLRRAMKVHRQSRSGSTLSASRAPAAPLQRPGRGSLCLATAWARRSSPARRAPFSPGVGLELGRGVSSSSTAARAHGGRTSSGGRTPRIPQAPPRCSKVAPSAYRSQFRERGGFLKNEPPAGTCGGFARVATLAKRLHCALQVVSRSFEEVCHVGKG